MSFSKANATKPDFSKTTDDCGKTWGCFRIPDNCADLNCDIIYKWKDAGDSTFFSLATKGPSQNPYSAIGFSDDQKMVSFILKEI
jgi:hypothetical protein